MKFNIYNILMTIIEEYNLNFNNKKQAYLYFNR